ncbi:MAG: hypothetical protein V3R16_07380 [Nitrospirales bacterium]
MADNNCVCAFRFPDGSIKWYVDEETAVERGADPSKLMTVEVPRDLWTNGTIQEVGEYVATRLETQEGNSG